jgi:hypothetical protein
MVCLEYCKKYSQALQVTFLISKIFSDFFDPELE